MVEEQPSFKNGLAEVCRWSLLLLAFGLTLLLLALGMTLLLLSVSAAVEI